MTAYANLQRNLNKMTPAAGAVKLGDILVDLLNAYNDLATKHNALLAHLDAANVAGIGAANAATYGATSTSLPLLNARPKAEV